MNIYHFDFVKVPIPKFSSSTVPSVSDLNFNVTEKVLSAATLILYLSFPKSSIDEAFKSLYSMFSPLSITMLDSLFGNLACQIPVKLVKPLLSLGAYLYFADADVEPSLLALQDIKTNKNKQNNAIFLIII